MPKAGLCMLLSIAAVVAALLSTPSAVARSPSRFCLKSLSDLAAKPSAKQPEMMAIGDSLYNGVTSLTIDAHRAEHSAPAFVAKALGIEKFRTPPYPLPILFDLEKELRKTLLGLAGTIGKDIQTNIIAWESKPVLLPSFDDIAVAQADSTQMMCDTAKDADDWIKTHPLQTGALGIPTGIAQWYYELNSRFILGSTGANSPDWQRSQLAQVLIRQPKRLLVDIGANDGMWLMAFRGYRPDEKYSPSMRLGSNSCASGAPCTTVRDQLGDFVQNMAMVAKLLAPTRIKYIYLNNLPPPSRTANLNPLAGGKFLCANDLSDPDRRVPYFKWYQNYISDTQLRLLKGEDVCKMDQLVSEINARVKAAMQPILRERLVIVDLNSRLMELDGKDLGAGHGAKVVIKTPHGPVAVELDNRVVHVGLDRVIDSGGFAGFDNMHPSYVGYALMAQLVLQAIQKRENITFNQKIVDPQAVVDQIENATLDSAVLINQTQDANLRMIHALLELPVARTREERISADSIRGILAIINGPEHSR